MIIIMKPPLQPQEVSLLDALLRRLPKSHPKWPVLDEEYGKRFWGFRGEQSMQYYLKLLPDRRQRIFYSLRLPCNGNRFQIDLLLIFPTVIFVIETKHWAGELYFNPGVQVIKTGHEGRITYSCPLNQASTQSFQLRMWIDQHGFPGIPIHHLAVLTNSKAIIENPEHLPPEIMRADSSIHYLNTHLKNSELTSSHHVSDSQIEKISRQLLADHRERITTLNTYELDASDLMHGVICPYCGRLPMTRSYNSWCCTPCGRTAPDAHEAALMDYRLLMGRFANNKQIRNFIQVEDRYVVQRLMQKLGCKSTGEKRTHRYDLMSF